MVKLRHINVQKTIVCFEDTTKCPRLEDEVPRGKDIPYCVMLYNKLTLWTLDELCYKNFTECPAYKKFLQENKKCSTE